MLPAGVLGPPEAPPAGLEGLTTNDIGPYQVYEIDPGNVQVLWWKFTAPAAGTYIFDTGLSLYVEEVSETPPYTWLTVYPTQEAGTVGGAWSVLGDIAGTSITMTAGQTVWIGAYGGAAYDEVNGLSGPVAICLRATGQDGIIVHSAQGDPTEAQVLGYGSLTADGAIELPLSLSEPEVGSVVNAYGDSIGFRYLLIMAAAKDTTNTNIVIEGAVPDPEATGTGGSSIPGLAWRAISQTYPTGPNYVHSVVVVQRIPEDGLPIPEGLEVPTVSVTFPEGVGAATVIAVYWEHNINYRSHPYGNRGDGTWTNAELSVAPDPPGLVGPSLGGDVPGDWFTDDMGGMVVFANYPELGATAFDPEAVTPRHEQFDPALWRRLLPVDPDEAALAELDWCRAYLFRGSNEYFQPYDLGAPYIHYGLYEIGGPLADVFTFVPFGTESDIDGEFDIGRARFT